jgi:hypothetical protein
MGTDETSSKKNDSFYENDLNNVNDFYGLKSSSKIDNASFKDEENDSLSRKELYSKTSGYNAIFPTTFEWDNGGNSVFVTGSFCQWKQFFLMKKDSSKNFVLNLNLPRGIHQYKFKVDGEWKYNPKFPICNDGGNINNYLDTTNLEINIKTNDEGITAISTNITENNNDPSKASKKYSKNLLKVNSELSQNQNQNEFFDKITTVPIHFKNTMNLDLITNQNNIGIKKYMSIKEKNVLSDNLSFKKINTAPIEQINHLNSKNLENQSIICAVSSRFRYKFTTFVYYKPKNQ